MYLSIYLYSRHARSVLQDGNDRVPNLRQEDEKIHLSFFLFFFLSWVGLGGWERKMFNSIILLFSLLLVAVEMTATFCNALMLDRSDFFNQIISSTAVIVASESTIGINAMPEEDYSVCSNGALVPEQAVPGAYSQICMTLPERVVPLGGGGDVGRGGGGDIVIRQEASGSGKTGLAVWNSGLVLTRIIEKLATQDPNWFSKQQIVELGCGTGLVSIACHRLGAQNVLATDGNPDVVANAERNFKLNNCDSSTTSGQVLQWGLLNAMDFEESADVVIGADLTYNSGTWRVLAETMETVLRPNGIVLYLSLGHQGFNVNAEVDGFLSAAEQTGLVQTFDILGGIDVSNVVSSVLSPSEKNQLKQTGGVRLAALKKKALNKKR